MDGEPDSGYDGDNESIASDFSDASDSSDATIAHLRTSHVNNHISFYTVNFGIDIFYALYVLIHIYHRQNAISWLITHPKNW